MNNLKYTDLLKDKKTLTSSANPLTLPLSNGFAPPQYVALTADGSVGGEGKLPTTKPGLPPIPNTELSGKDEGGETVVETPPMSYEEYILSLKSKADDTYKRSIVNAQNTYDHSRSAYGENAAALGNMGLTGSGYSQYLDSKAYAQRSADMNAAGAVRADAYANADAQYMDYLNQKETEAKNEALQKETNAKNAYMSLYEALMANPDTYSSDDISKLGGMMGLSEDDITGLNDVRIEKTLASGTYDKDKLLDMFGSEDNPKYQEYYNKLVSEAESIEDFTDADGTLMDKNTAQAIIDNMKDLGVDTTDIQKKFDSQYKVNDVGIKFNKDGGTDKPGEAGNNMSVVDKDGNKYRVEYTGNTVSEAVNNLGKSVDDNTVFKYDGSLYVKVNGVIYSIGARPMWQGHYNELLKQFDDKKTEGSTK
jgi:hypothetical protein